MRSIEWWQYRWPWVTVITRNQLYYYFASVGSEVLRWACSYVCMSVRSHTSKTTSPNFIKFSVHDWPWLGRTVLLRRQCNKLCTSGFVDDIMFGHNRPGRGDASRVYIQSDSPGGQHRGRSVISTTALLRFVSFFIFMERLTLKYSSVVRR